MKTLQKHKHRLSVASYEAHHKVKLPDALVSQYSVPGGEGMLLSKSARNNGVKYLCCRQCKVSLRGNMLNAAPPKFAICNGFAFGAIPRSVIKEEDLTAMISSLVAPVRPFSFVFSYFAGAQKSIRGHVTFMQNDVEHLGATLHKYKDKAFGNPHIYVVLCGRFTPRQRIITKDLARLDTTKFFDLLRWFIEESGNPAFKDMMLPEECPSPHFIEDNPSANNTDEEVDAEAESRFTGSRFYFPSASEPNENTGTFGSEESFIKAMFEGSTPALLVHGGKYVSDRDVPITDMFPIQFPFGQGGTHLKRRNPVSVKECLRHYFCVALNQMQCPDFVLVVTSMYNRIQAFDTGFVMCKMNMNGRSWGEDISCLTSSQIAAAAKRKDDKMPVGGAAGRLFTAISTACKPIGHTNEAAAAGRRKMLALGDLFGESSIFLSVTPDDENSFRVKLLVSRTKEALPSLDWSDEECIAEMDVRKKVRTSYPGACSWAFQDIMESVVSAIIRWDKEDGFGREGLFGVPIAYGRADEEQGRNTLHAHLQIWIENFNKLQKLLFHEDVETRLAAKEEMIRYIDKVMSASYGLEVSCVHRCCEESSSTLRGRAPQVIRDCRHSEHSVDMEGEVMECSKCLKPISSKDVVKAALDRWKGWQSSEAPDRFEGDCLESGRLEMAAGRHPYDFCADRLVHRREADAESLGGGSLWTDAVVRDVLLHWKYDEHDYNHRPSCFKKGVECRFGLPKMANPKTYIAFDETNSIDWYQIDGSVLKVCPFEVVLERKPGDEFVNTFNKALASMIGSNTNIQIGDFAHVYYSTLYVSKSTQKEDTQSFLAVSNALDKKLAKAASEGNACEGPDFVEGVSRTMSGIRANLAANIFSATTGHLMVTQGGRFLFSHEFSHLLVTQIDNALEGMELSCRFKKGKKNKDGETTWWPDCFANDYLYRPEEIEGVCSYELAMKFEKVYTKKSSNDRLQFADGHPGKGQAFLAKLKCIRVPIISMTKGLPDVRDLELSSLDPSDLALYRREEYARKALIMFFPFRTKNDLKGTDGTFWSKFALARDSGALWATGLDVLQNIQNRLNSSQMKRPADHVEVLTSCKEGTGGGANRTGDDDFDFDISEVEAYFDEMFQSSIDSLDAVADEDKRTHKILRDRGTVPDKYLIKAPFKDESIFLSNNEDGVNESKSKKGKGPNKFSLPDYPAVVEFVEATLIDNDFDGTSVSTGDVASDAEDCSHERKMPSMARVAKEFALDRDRKQKATYEIICSTFLLDVLKDGGDSSRHISSLHEALDSDTEVKRDELIQRLRSKAAKVEVGSSGSSTNPDQLLMFLTGPAGCGKSHALYAAQKFCKHFCTAAALPCPLMKLRFGSSFIVHWFVCRTLGWRHHSQRCISQQEDHKRGQLQKERMSSVQN